MNTSVIETDRLILRQFNDGDFDAYCKIMGQDEVGRWLPKGKGYMHEDVERLMNHILKHWEEYGFGIWAVDEKESGKLVGHCGINFVEAVGGVEVLYSFGKESWGKGYATEAAKAAIDYGFKEVKLDKIIAFSKLDNKGSRNVIEKIGLNYVKDMDIFGMTCAYYELKK